MTLFKHCFGLLGIVCVLLFDGMNNTAIEFAVSTAFDPCTSYTYMNMHNGRRSDEWTKTPQDSICDWREYPSTSWRRFEHDAGVQMSTTVVPFQQCGTQVPIWMNGTHPSESDGIVSRQVCANFGNGSICNWTAEAQVKHCSQPAGDVIKHFYIYILPNPIGCMMAYCVDGKTKKNCSAYGQVWNPAELRCIDMHCGSQLRNAPASDLVPSGWSMLCYITKQEDPDSWTQQCKSLLIGLPVYDTADGLLAKGGNFGCYAMSDSNTDGPESACINNYQHEMRPAFCSSCNKFSVCIRFPQD